MSEMLARLPINGYCFQLPITLVETIMPHGTLQYVQDNVQSIGRKQISKYNWNSSFPVIQDEICLIEIISIVQNFYTMYIVMIFR